MEIASRAMSFQRPWLDVSLPHGVVEDLSQSDHDITSWVFGLLHPR
jgi:hypothetical protein